MKDNKKKELKNASKGLLLDTVLEVGSSVMGDAMKSSITSLIGELAVDSMSSLIPGVSGAVQGYKRKRFEENITNFVNQLLAHLEQVNKNLEFKTTEQKIKVDQLFNIVMDYVIDEPQEEKIKYMVNGFVDLTSHENVSEDFVLTYYDVLKELRMVDISVLRLMYKSKYEFYREPNETFRDVMEAHGISYHQYQSVRENLKRVGLLVTRADLHITDDLEEISKRFKELYAYLDKASNPKYTRSLPKLQPPKFKSKETLELSRFGKDFVKFFMDRED